MNYEKPVLTKHAQLREVTLSSTGTGGNPGLGDQNGNGQNTGKGNSGVGDNPGKGHN